MTARDEDRFFRYHEACWRRSLTYRRANRILAKTSMLTLRLDAVLRRYPDCKLVYVIRDPVEVIPSGMSLLAGVLENAYDVWNRTREEDQRRWLENLYQASCDMLRSFHEAHSAGLIPERNLCVVRYSDLIQDLEPTMKRILEFIEVEPTPAFVEEVRAQAERQRNYKSRHQHSPEKFDLDPERIRRDLGSVYDAFRLSGQPAEAPLMKIPEIDAPRLRGRRPAPQRRPCPSALGHREISSSLGESNERFELYRSGRGAGSSPWRRHSHHHRAGHRGCDRRRRPPIGQLGDRRRFG